MEPNETTLLSGKIIAEFEDDASGAIARNPDCVSVPKAEWISEPSEHPEPRHFQDATQKGLGRAPIWAAKGIWTEKDILLNACLKDLRYDHQCEDARGPWLWKLMALLGVTDEFRDAILDSLSHVANSYDGQQLCQVAVNYARDGDDRFRQRLRDIVTRKPDPSDPSFGEGELIELDGEEGFLFAARIRSDLSPPEWGGDLIERAISLIGEPTVLAILDRESKSSPAMLRLYEEWRSVVQKRTTNTRQSHADRMRQISLGSAIQAAESKDGQIGLLHGWGMYADEADLRVVLDRLLNAKETTAIQNYLRVFSNRPMPEFNEKILSLLDHADENTRFRAYSALAPNTHPLVRKFTLDHLNDRMNEPGFLKLLVRNFLPGDEAALLACLCPPEDQWTRHSYLMDLLEVLKDNPEAKCQELATIIYCLTPCSSCRHRAAKLLIDRNVAPRWLIDECQYDAVEDTRRLVENRKNGVP